MQSKKTEMSSSVRYITNKIIELENSNKLFEWQINDIFIWEIIRCKIYSIAVLQNLGNSTKSEITKSKKNIHFFLKLVSRSKRYLNAIVYNPFFDKKKVEILVFESSRKYLFNGKYIDPYTEFTCQELNAKGTSFTKYQSSYSFDKLAKRNYSVKSLDLIYLLTSFKCRFSTLKIEKVNLEKISAIGQIINQVLGVCIDLEKLIEKEIKFFKQNSRYFGALLKRKKAKEIYIVNFCDKPALIAIAKEFRIKVIDIQHGLISSDDIIYNYPNVKENSLHYFPDQYYVWSKIWEKNCKIPLKSDDIVDYGNKFLDNQKNNYLHLKKIDNQILIISQPGLTKQILSLVLKNSGHLLKYQILFKFHPDEQINEYSELLSLKEMKGFSIVKGNQDLYKLMAESKFVIGVYSTALVEALSFECKVLLFDLPGVEMMTPFMDRNDMQMFDSNNFN